MDIKIGKTTAFAATGGRPFDKAQPTIVFIHGAGLDRSVWSLQTRYFAYHGYNVLAIDMPGHGRTPGPVLSTIPEMADWIMAMLDALDIEAAALVGHSLGSLVAFDAAARYPNRVTALALLGTSIPMGVTDLLLNAARENDHSAFDMVTLWGHSQDGQNGASKAPGLWMTGGSVSLLERSAPGILHAGLNAANEYRDGLEIAGNITCPTLLVLGTRDAMTPAKTAKPLADTIPGARTTILAGCGHMMMAEQPDEVLDALISIL